MIYESNCIKFERDNNEMDYPQILKCKKCNYMFHLSCLINEIPYLRNCKDFKDFTCLQC